MISVHSLLMDGLLLASGCGLENCGWVESFVGGGGGVKTPERLLYRSVILYETVPQIPNTSE
jgi:hypothetical protein